MDINKLKDLLLTKVVTGCTDPEAVKNFQLVFSTIQNEAEADNKKLESFAARADIYNAETNKYKELEEQHKALQNKFASYEPIIKAATIAKNTEKYSKLVDIKYLEQAIKIGDIDLDKDDEKTIEEKFAKVVKEMPILAPKVIKTDPKAPYSIDKIALNTPSNTPKPVTGGLFSTVQNPQVVVANEPGYIAQNTSATNRLFGKDYGIVELGKK